MTHTKDLTALKKRKSKDNKNQKRPWVSQQKKKEIKDIHKYQKQEKRGNKVKQILNINVSHTPNSCLIYVGKTRWRALIDTGADISVISEKMYKKLKKKVRIKPVSHVLQGAGGKPLQVKGITEITFKLGKKEYSQTCYVIKEASRNLILGVDFLKKNQARIYFDLEKIRLNDEYIDLDQDIHIASVVRMASDVTLPPQSKQTLEGKIKKSLYFNPGQICEFK